MGKVIAFQEHLAQRLIKCRNIRHLILNQIPGVSLDGGYVNALLLQNWKEHIILLQRRPEVIVILQQLLRGDWGIHRLHLGFRRQDVGCGKRRFRD